MSLYGSQRALNISRRGSRSDLSGGGFPYARSEMVGGNGFAQEYVEGGYYTYSKGSGSGGQRCVLSVFINQSIFEFDSLYGDYFSLVSVLCVQLATSLENVSLALYNVYFNLSGRH